MSRFAALQQRFDAMQPRERMLISVTAGVLLVLGLYVLWIEPASKTAAANAAQIESLAPQVESARVALARVQEELARDPEAERRVALDRLKQESAELDGRLRTDEAAVIPPGRMPAVLRDLLGRDARLKVLGVRALPPEVLRWSPAPAPSPSPGARSDRTRPRRRRTSRRPPPRAFPRSTATGWCCVSKATTRRRWTMSVPSRPCRSACDCTISRSMPSAGRRSPSP